MEKMVLDSMNLYRVYKKIGEGNEGKVYIYNDLYVLKIFYNYIDFDKRASTKKIKKIEELSKIKDESFCFPTGLVDFYNSKMYGYYMKFIDEHSVYHDYSNVNLFRDLETTTKLVTKLSNAIERIHKQNVIIGDIKGDNILINKNENPIFIDTDNYKIDKYGFDLFPDRITWLRRVYKNKKFSDIDCDKFSLAIMCLEYFLKEDFQYENLYAQFLKKLIEEMDIDKEAKDGLSIIFSDADNKPYIGPIIEKMNLKQKILLKK